VYLEDNKIVNTECECPRGSYKCSHAAALFIHGIHNLSRTDIECSWKKQKVPVVVKSISEMYPPPKNYNPLEKEVEQAKAVFYNDLKAYSQFTGLGWILSPEPKRDQTLPIKTVDDILKSTSFVQSSMNLDCFLNEMKITESQQIAAHEATKGQRNNPNWQILRRGRLTASNFGHVLKAKRVTPSLLKRVLGEYDLSGVKAVSWGIDNEQEAIKAFEAATHLKVEESGIWISRSGILGASPDGLVGHNGTLEVKCPYTCRNCTLDEATKNSKDFFLLQENGNFLLDRDHIYWHQVQGQMHITGRDICYFVTWTTREVATLVIKRDPNWEVNLDLLVDFYKMHLFNKLLEK